MNRPIKFRAWFPEDHWYHQGMLENWQDTDGPEDLGFVPDESTGIHIMQFTGLTDRNGVEIYEGDLIRRGMYLYQVFYQPLGARFSYEVVGRYSSLFSNVVKPHKGNGQLYSFLPDPKPVNEVIGSIHTHPELVNPNP